MRSHRLVVLAFAILAAVLGGCAARHTGAVDAGPQVDDILHSKSDTADRAFWAAFESQSYAELPTVRQGLADAYAAEPKDPENTLLLAHSNLWTLSEFGRTPPPAGDPSTLPARAMDALKYFGEARALAPADGRIPGWLGALEIAIGNITQNAALGAQGQADLAAGVSSHPEFNLFVRALVNGQLPRTDPAFASAIDDMWKTLDLCAGEPVDRTNPDFTKYLSRQTTTGPQRVCWNDDKAAHNFEGFFLYMGDLLVKQGDVTTAAKVYANAKVLPSYASWPFRPALEQRIGDAAANAALFADADATNDPLLAVQSPTACANCHAKM